MNFQNFIQKYTKQRIDVDNQFGYQCWDLAQEYVNEFWGIDYWLSCRTTGGVKDIYNDFDRVFEKDKFIRYPNLRDTVPNIGDLVVWGYGEFGHIAIVVEATASKLIVFEQNAGQGDGDGLNGDECKITKYGDWSGILGFITPKNKETQEPKLSQVDSIVIPQNDKLPTSETWAKLEKETDLNHKTYLEKIINDKNWNLLINDYTDRVKERNTAQIELQKTINDLREELGQKELKITELGNKITNLEKDLIAKNNLIESLKTKNSNNLPKNESDFTIPLKNQPQNLENFNSDKIFKNIKNHSQIENIEVKNPTTQEKWSWNKFWVGLSRNATISSIIGIIITALVGYICSVIPELKPYQSQMIGGLLFLTGVSTVSQNANNLLKKN